MSDATRRPSWYSAALEEVEPPSAAGAGQRWLVGIVMVLGLGWVLAWLAALTAVVFYLRPFTVWSGLCLGLLWLLAVIAIIAFFKGAGGPDAHIGNEEPPHPMPSYPSAGGDAHLPTHRRDQ